MHGGHVVNFEFCREHFGKPSSKIGTWSVLHTAYNVASLRHLSEPIGTLNFHESGRIRGDIPIDFCVLSRIHGFMIRSSQTHPLLWNRCICTNSPFQGALGTSFYILISQFHATYFFWNNCPAFLKVPGSDGRLTYFCSGELKRFPLIAPFISGSEMRLAQMWCARRFDKKTQIASEPTSTLHIFVKILGSKFGLVLHGVTRHSQVMHLDLLGLFRLKGLQLMSITIERCCCPHGWCLGTQLCVWFQLPENCLRGDTRSGH